MTKAAIEPKKQIKQDHIPYGGGNEGVQEVSWGKTIC